MLWLSYICVVNNLMLCYDCVTLMMRLSYCFVVADFIVGLYDQMDVAEVKSGDYPPRLYPEGSSNLDGKVINHNFHPGHFPHVRETIGLDVWEELVNSPIGVVSRLAERESMWSGRTVHYLLCRHLRVIKKEIWCLVADEAIRFSLLEFGEITGLNTGPLPTEKFDPGQYNEFWGGVKGAAWDGTKVR